MVSLDVEIFRPVGGVPDGFAVTAASAARVRPLHVTVTAPAARVALPPRVSVMTFNAYDVTTVVDGAGMPQAVPPDIAVTKWVLDGVNGNAKIIASVAVNAVEVVKVIAAVPTAPTAELSCNAVAAFAITAPTAGVLT